MCPWGKKKKRKKKKNVRWENIAKGAPGGLDEEEKRQKSKKKKAKGYID